MIKSKHPVRDKVASLSTTNNYYNFKGDFIRAIDDVLEEFGWTTGDCDLYGDNGRQTVNVVLKDERGNLVEEVGQVILSWYRMPSGRYEMTCYLS
jgi:hypothetical protein